MPSATIANAFHVLHDLVGYRQEGHPVVKAIEKTEELLPQVFGLKRVEGDCWYYRGHADRRFKLEPSIFRSPTRLENEDRLFRELLALNPTDFLPDRTTLEKLVRMQHYSLPTRLLDITSNPLVALYFACCEHPDATGEVLAFRIREKEIKFVDSDTASCISNLALLSKQHKDRIVECLRKGHIDSKGFNTSAEIRQLLHFIRDEKPYFQDRIVPADLGRVLCVRSKMSNRRIVSQAGAFFLFGLDASLGNGQAPCMEIIRIPVKASAKSNLLAELDALSINHMSIFPYIENTARYIKERYDDKAAPKSPIP